jgi:hypothetical protein
MSITAVIPNSRVVSYSLMGDSDNGVLNDHQQYGTEFVPSFVDNFGDTLQYTNWQYKMLPDFVWIALLLDEHNSQEVIDIVTTCSETAVDIGEQPSYILLSTYDTLSEDEIQSLKQSLDEKLLKKLKKTLGPLCFYYPTFPLSPLFDDVDIDEGDALKQLQRVVDKCYDRNSRTAVLAQAVYVTTMIKQGRMKLPPDFDVDNINAVVDYPNTDESRKAGSTVRAMTKSMAGIDSDDSNWPERFWENGFEIGECWFPDRPRTAEDIPEETLNTLLAMGVEFDESMRKAAVDLWKTADRSIGNSTKESVLDGLFMRQIDYASNLATSPNLWNYTLGNIIIRCMVDTQITMGWFESEGSEEDYETFVEHGLGQEKLAIEHAESYAEDAGEERAQFILKDIDKKKERLKEQKYTFLISVDVGAWNKSTRDMAIESGQKQIYDLSYSPKSDIAHGMWNSLESENLMRCGNPLHKYHRIPNFHSPAVVPFCLVDAGNMLNRSIESWMNARNADPEGIDIPDLSANAREILSGAKKEEEE